MDRPIRGYWPKIVVTGAATQASEADKLRALWDKQAADTAVERKAREDDLRAKTAKAGTALTLLTGPAGAVYAAAAQTFVEGAIALGNLFNANLNSKDFQDRALSWVSKFMGKGWVPPAFNPYTQFAAGYGDLLEGIWNVANSFPNLNRFGQLFLKFGKTDPIVQAIGNDSSRSFGFFSGQVQGNQRLYPERALLAARLVSLDKGVDYKVLSEKALATWQHPIDWSQVPRDEKGNPSDVSLYTSSLSYTFNVADAWGSELKSSSGGASTATKVVIGGSILAGLIWWWSKSKRTSSLPLLVAIPGIP